MVSCWKVEDRSTATKPQKSLKRSEKDWKKIEYIEITHTLKALIRTVISVYVEQYDKQNCNGPRGRSMDDLWFSLAMFIKAKSKF
jgi:hypothetical protein